MKNDGLITKKNNWALIFLLMLTAIYGALLIFFFPSFHTDDFLVFSYIDAHKASPIALDPAADYYLFFRPLSYLYFWADYHVFGTNAVLMKAFGFCIFLVLTYVVFKVLSLVNEEYELKAHPALIAFATFFFVSHPDMLHCIVWISNANELLMVFFYVCAIYVFMKTKMTTTASVIAVALMALLSLLAKQQSMHLILLAGLYLLQSAQKDNKNDTRRARGIIAAGLLVIVAYTVITNSVVHVNPEILSYAWKKPFALLGTIIYVLIPISGEKIYQFFVIHKGVAVVAACAALLLFVVCFMRSMHKKKILWFLVMSLVIFFPRILAHGGDRVNSVQVFWLCAVLFYVLARYRDKKIITAGAMLLLGLNMAASIMYEHDYITSNALGEKTDREFLELTHGREAAYLILIAGDTYLLDYSTHFLMTNKFGKSQYQAAPFMVNNMLESSSAKNSSEEVRCEIANDELCIFTVLPHAYLSVDFTSPLYNSFKILETRESNVGRGYSYIRCVIPQEKISLQKIYFNGKHWERL
jgi:hypothetical protein